MIEPKKAHQLGQSGIIRGADGLPYYDPNQKAMHPFLARGLGLNHGDLHRIFFYDPVVSGVFTLMMVEILRAHWSATFHRNETNEERTKRRLLEVVLGLKTPDGSQEWGIMAGGLRRLIFHLFWANLYGFSLCELSWDYVTIDGKRFLVPVGCEFRAPWSINRWVYQRGRLVGCTQLVTNHDYSGNNPYTINFKNTPAGFSERYIPLDKCLLRSNRGVDGNPEGISDFRTSYIYVKAKIEQVIRDQIAEERLSNGIVLIKEGGNEYGPYRHIGQEDRDSLKALLQLFAAGKTNRIAVPFGIDFEIMWPTYDRPQSTDRLQYLDKQIMLGSTSSLLGLDATRAASRGLQDSLATIAFHSIENNADDIASVANGVPGQMWTGLVKKLFAVNGLLGKGRPVRVEHFGISHQSARELVETLARGNQMLVVATDAHDEVKYREAARLGSSDVKSIEKQRDKIVQQNGQLMSQGEQQKTRQPNQSKNKQQDGNNDSAKE